MAVLLRSNFAAEPGSEDFKRQADTYTLQGAKGAKQALESRRAAMTEGIDTEIGFLEKVIKYKEENA